MAKDDEKNNVVETVEVNNTSSFLKMAGVAIGSYYFSKSNPEVFASLTKSLKSQQDLADQTESDIVKTASGTIADLLTKNALERKKRVNDNLTNIEVLTGAGLSNTFAASASKSGMGTQLLAIKKKYPNIDLNGLYKAIDKNPIQGYSKLDLARLLAGRKTKPDIDYSKFKGSPSGFDKFLGVGGDKSIQDRIKSRVGASDTTGTNRDFNEEKFVTGTSALSNVALTEDAINLMANANTKNITVGASTRAVAGEVADYMGLDMGASSGDSYIFANDAGINATIAKKMINKITNLIERDLQVNNASKTPNMRMSRTTLRSKYMSRYFGLVSKQTGKNSNNEPIFTEVAEPLKDDKDNFIINEGGDVISNTWTSTGNTSTSLKQKKATPNVNKKQAEIDVLTKKMQARINIIESNKGITQIQKDKSIKDMKNDLAKQIAAL